MGESTDNTTALMRRILQLENERDELQKDIEGFCVQQSNESGIGVDLLARFQAQRVAGLEQELGSCKGKLAHVTRENNNLQEEISQAYNIKSQLADLYKAEIEKNKEVEKEVKFFQSKVAAALAERDRALLEADKARSREDSMKSQLSELKERTKLMEIDYAKQQESCVSLQQTLDELKSNSEIFNQKSLVEELLVLRSTTLNSQQQLEKEYEARCKVEGKVSALESHLSLLKEVLATELRQLQIWHVNAKEAVKTYLHNAGNSLSMLMKSLQETVESRKLASMQQEIVYNIHPDDAIEFRDNILDKDIEVCNQREEIQRQLSSTNEISEGVHFSDKGVVENQQNVVIQANEEAFVQAMQEKVAALLLLSQEEERHYLKENMVKGLEEQISQLNQKLSQVASEKVGALLEVAQLRQDVKNLQDERRKLAELLQQHHSTSESGRLLPAAYTDSLSDAHGERIQSKVGDHKVLTRSLGVSKWNWWRGSSTNSILENSGKTLDNNKNDGIENARLRIENAAMQEYVINLQQLTKSVHRLALTLSQVCENSCDGQGEQSLKAAFHVVEGVASEAQHLKVALSCSLPLSCCGGNSVEHFWLGQEKMHSADTLTNEVADIPSVGISMVNLLLVTCRIQKSILEREMRAQLLPVQG